MRKRSVYIIIISLLVLTGLVLCANHQVDKVESAELKVKFVEKELESLQSEQILKMKSENSRLSNNTSFLYLNNEELKIEELRIDNVISKRYLVLFISNDYCSDCVAFCLDQIKQYSNEVSLDRVVVFASGYNMRDLMVSFKSNKIACQVFSLDSLGLPIEELKMPYMFVLDKNLTPMHLFVPRKEYPHITKLYFQNLKDIL